MGTYTLPCLQQMYAWNVHPSAFALVPRGYYLVSCHPWHTCSLTVINVRRYFDRYSLYRLFLGVLARERLGRVLALWRTSSI